jgi:hypothetical protein
MAEAEHRDDVAPLNDCADVAVDVRSLPIKQIAQAVVLADGRRSGRMVWSRLRIAFSTAWGDRDGHRLVTTMSIDTGTGSASGAPFSPMTYREALDLLRDGR